MRWLTRLTMRVRMLFGRRAAERELDRELAEQLRSVREAYQAPAAFVSESRDEAEAEGEPPTQPATRSSPSPMGRWREASEGPRASAEDAAARIPSGFAGWPPPALQAYSPTAWGR